MNVPPTQPTVDFAAATRARSPHPFVYTLLIVPFGAVGGYVTVAMAFMATTHGLTVEQGALLVAAQMLPHVWKFFWAPIVDTTLSRKRWYYLSLGGCVAGTVAMSAITMAPHTLKALTVVVFMANLASTFLGMSVEGLMAHATPPEQRGRVGGWFQAGNLGGQGLGGGLGLWLATHVPSEKAPMPWIAGSVLGLCFILGSLVLRFVPEAYAEARPSTLWRSMVGVAVDLWQTVASRKGVLCGVLCILPIGTGAATSVLAQADVAANWGVGENTVSLVNGVMNGLVSAVGCLVGGEICARYNPRVVYAAVGGLMAMVATAMALLWFTPANYVIFTLAYAFVTGLAYAAFTGFVLDAIGKGAAATKYNGFASLSNTPTTYMGLILAAVFTSAGGENKETVARGAKYMLLTEAGAGILGIAILGVVAMILQGTKLRQAARLSAAK